MTIPTLPPYPSRGSAPDTFSLQADAFVAAMPAWGVAVQAVGDQAATDAATASDAASLAVGAAAGVAASVWVSGTTYAIGDARYSPADLQTYRRRTPGAGTIDPSLDTTNWARLALGNAGQRLTRSSNTALTSFDAGRVFDLSGTWTQTFDAAALLGNGWHCYLRNTSNGDITLDPAGSELIDGAATFVLKPGHTIMLMCDGSALTPMTLQSRTYPNVAEYTASDTLTVPPDTYVIRPYAIGAGAAGTTTYSGGGGGCAYGDVAVIPGQAVTLTISAGVATVVVGGVTVLTGNAASGTAPGTASKHASVTHGGAYSGGTGAGTGAYRGGASSGSPLGTGVNGTAGGGSGWGGAGSSSGGGGVGAAAGSSRGGRGLLVPSTDPLLDGLTGTGGGLSSVLDLSFDGQPGAGAGTNSASNTTIAGNGGFGGGGGYCSGTASYGGNGGFGGGGGGGANGGGAGGYGGGGGGGASAGGAGGAAVIRIYY